MRNDLKCRLCNKTFANLGGLGHHLTSNHDYEKEKYYRKYMAKGSEGKCAHCGNATTFVTLGMGFRRLCSVSCQMYERMADPKYAAHWRSKKSSDGKAYAQTLAGKKQFAELAKKASKRMKLLHKDENFTKELSEVAAKGLRSAWKNRRSEIIAAQNHGKSTPEYKARRSELSTQMLLDPSCGFGSTSPRGKQHKYAGYILRSTWELNFARVLDKLALRWKYESKTFCLKNGQRYTPDFYLIDYKLYVEIKPEYFVTDSVLSKLKEVRKQGKRIGLLTENNWDSFLSKLANDDASLYE